MKHIFSFLMISISLIVFWGCPPKPVVTPDAATIDDADRQFASAEKLLTDDFPRDALLLYRDFLQQHPDHPMAPAALMKIGQIHVTLKNYAEARYAYEQLLTQFPQSAFLNDARFEILHTYYRQGEYQEVIARAPLTLNELDSRESVFKTYALVGDAYLASGYALDAFRMYFAAQGQSSESEQEFIMGKMKEAVAQIETENIQLLLDIVDQDQLRGDLLFQLGLNFTMQEKYHEAMAVLQRLIEQ
jgi:tetratricopeptide (TPR) repeat protein